MALTNTRDQMDKYSLQTAAEYLGKACAEEAPMRNLLSRDRDLQQARPCLSSGLADGSSLCMTARVARRAGHRYTH